MFSFYLLSFSLSYCCGFVVANIVNIVADLVIIFTVVVVAYGGRIATRVAVVAVSLDALSFDT